MWKLCGSPSVKRKFKGLFPSLPHHLIFIFGIAFCAQVMAGSSKVAYFAGGCYWCTEAVFQQAPGVSSVVSGYMRNAETIQIMFDSAITSYDKLLDLFWRAHDSTQVDRQGPDIGKQYRSAIFYVGEEQRAAAEKSEGANAKIVCTTYCDGNCSSILVSSRAGKTPS